MEMLFLFDKIPEHVAVLFEVIIRGGSFIHAILTRSKIVGFLSMRFRYRAKQYLSSR